MFSIGDSRIAQEFEEKAQLAFDLKVQADAGVAPVPSAASSMPEMKIDLADIVACHECAAEVNIDKVSAWRVILKKTQTAKFAEQKLLPGRKPIYLWEKYYWTLINLPKPDDEKGTLPLFRVIQACANSDKPSKEQIEFAKCFIRWPATMSVPVDRHGRSALHILCEQTSLNQEFKQFAEWLVNTLRVDLVPGDILEFQSYFNPLHVAATKQKDPWLIRLVVDYFPEFLCKNKLGNMPSEKAADPACRELLQDLEVRFASGKLVTRVKEVSNSEVDKRPMVRAKRTVRSTQAFTFGADVAAFSAPSGSSALFATPSVSPLVGPDIDSYSAPASASTAATAPVSAAPPPPSPLAVDSDPASTPSAALPTGSSPSCT